MIAHFEDTVTENPQVKEYKTIEKREGYNLVYYVMNMGVMTERDAVIEIKTSTNEKGQFTSIV